MLLGVGTTASAQEEMLIDGDIDHGGYGGMNFKGTTILGEPALMVGGGGAWIIDHTFLLGLQGGGLATIVDAERNDPTGAPYRLQISEGGLKLGYVYASDNLVHGIAGVMIGGGTVFYTDRYDWPGHMGPIDEYEVDAYFVIEPEAMAEVNIARWMRVAGGAGYRFVGDVDYDRLTNEDLSGPTATLILKFGSF
jgi:hypothetical protein